jgi:MFS family permease
MGALLARPAFARTVSSLHVRNYRLYFIGQSISVAGTFMQTLALSFLVLKLTGSGTILGLTLGIRLLPFATLGPYGGLVADRTDKLRLLYLTQALSAAAALLLAVLNGLGAVSLPVILVLSLLLGFVMVFDTPTRQSLIPELVPRSEVANAVTLNSVALNVARVIGAAAGGLLVSVVGFTACFAANALSFAAVLAGLSLMRRSEMFPAEPVVRSKGQVREGIRYIRQTPILLLPLSLVFVTGMLAYEFPVSLPLIARGAFGGGAGTYGAMAAVMAAGAIAGGLVAASNRGGRRPQAIATAAAGWAIAILAAAVAPSLPLEFVALVFVGYGSITVNAYAKTTIQLAAEPSMRGRVMALWGLAWVGTNVVGGPLVGWVAEEFGSRWSLVVGGVPTLVLALAFWRPLGRLSLPGEYET